MAKTLYASPSGRVVAIALVCAVVLVGGFFVGRASAAQPHMTAALEHLRSAKSELQVAEADKGGHRVRALRLVNDAIEEVSAGIEHARTH